MPIRPITELDNVLDWLLDYAAPYCEHPPLSGDELSRLVLELRERPEYYLEVRRSGDDRWTVTKLYRWAR